MSISRDREVLPELSDSLIRNYAPTCARYTAASATGRIWVASRLDHDDVIELHGQPTAVGQGDPRALPRQHLAAVMPGSLARMSVHRLVPVHPAGLARWCSTDFVSNGGRRGLIRLPKICERVTLVAVALEEAGERAAGSTLYVSLEPCAHASERGPACAELIATAAPAKVVIAWAQGSRLT